MMPGATSYRKYFLALMLLFLFVGIAIYFSTSASETQDSGVSEEDSSIRADGEDFEGLAVFPTWSTLEPATFPVLIDGEARGTWFFEANFPVDIVLADGTIIARGYAQAQEDWMTEDVVPFYSELVLLDSAPEYVGPAALVLRRANPSGLPEHDAKFTTQIFIDTNK